jgi:hypothetical protein
MAQIDMKKLIVIQHRKMKFKKYFKSTAGYWWLTHVILSSYLGNRDKQDPGKRQIVHKTPSPK